ncbi:MAG: hypothetical protein ABJ327_17270 [Litoreibacter sp.]
MKITYLTAVSLIAFASPTFADTSAEELFAMSNNSAAETLSSETSMGDVDTAQISLALGNMSAAERMGFFEGDMSTRRQILAAQIKLIDCESAAECN